MQNDILFFEFEIREKLEELSWKTEALEDAKKELSTIHQQLNEQQMIVEDERRKVTEIKRQLHSVVEINRFLEKENTSHRSERHQLQTNYDLVLRERDSLLEQIRNLKVDNIQLNHEIKELKSAESINTVKYKNTEQTYHQMRDEIIQNMSLVNSNISKLGKEQDYLRKSVEGVICLNKRLQTVALCMHAHYKRQENVIQNLQRKLASVACIKPSTIKQDLVDRIPQNESQFNPQLIMSELKSQEEDLEKQLHKVLHELESLSNERQEH